MEAQAAFRGGDDPEEFPGQHLNVSRSVKEDYRQITLNWRQSEVWCAMDHGEIFVDLASPSQPPASKAEDDDCSFDFSDKDDSGDDADNLN
jgi:hypothetical protein